MALPQPDVVGILNRRGCLPVVGWRRLWVGVKAGQTLSPLQLQQRVTTSALTHPGVSALWISRYSSLRSAVRALSVQLWKRRSQTKPNLNEELLHNNKEGSHSCSWCLVEGPQRIYFLFPKFCVWYYTWVNWKNLLAMVTGFKTNIVIISSCSTF